MGGTQDRLEWHKFTKKSMPIACNEKILLLRDYGHDPFFMMAHVQDDGCIYMYTQDGMKELHPESRDLWTYIPYPEGAVKNDSIAERSNA